MFNRKDNRSTRVTASHDFEQAFQKGFWRNVLGWLTLSSNKLKPFDEVVRQYEFAGQHSKGNKTVPIEKIIGSVGRFRDFDSIFLPRQTNTRERWMRIDEAHLTDTPLPAIELYKIGDTYYVKDGNHRVSVARERGQRFIDAYVTEIELQKPAAEMGLVERIVAEERRKFYGSTRLKRNLGIEIEISHPGGYTKLLKHIEVHRWFLGEHRGEEVSWEEAVAGWHRDVYSPLIGVIRENKVMKDFPEDREGDLYLWIIEHLWYLREAYRKDVSIKDATLHFAEEYSPKAVKKIVKFFHKIASRLGIGDD